MGNKTAKSNKRLNIFVVVLMAAAVVSLAVTLAVSSARTDKVDAKVKDMTLHVDGSALKDADGNTVILRGVNVGGLFIQESWMCPTDMSGLERQDELSLRAKLVERFGADGARELLKAYREAWWSKEDFDNVKNAGLNLIRLPFGYFDIEDENGNLTEFSELDAFVNECAEREIYLILDLHGGYGSQNGKDHSGDTSEIALFTEENIAKTAKLWGTIAERYKGSGVIAGFDILNEPAGEQGHTDSLQWDAFDVIYKAIRANDDSRIVIMEGVWESYNMPSTRTYGWENVVYSYHNYNWGDENIDSAEKQIEFTRNKISSYALHKGVPTFIGEFTLFGQREAWEYAVNAYETAGISYAFWTYKVYAPKGSSLGMYTGGAEKADPVNDSYETILRKWSANGTSQNYKYNELYKNLFTKEN